MKVVISKEIIMIIRRYIRSYEQMYINRFSDTGIENEYIIHEFYFKNAQELFSNILKFMYDALGEDTIYGRHIHEDEPKRFTLIRTIQDRTLIIEYTEDIIKRVRTIESLQIMRE